MVASSVLAKFLSTFCSCWHCLASNRVKRFNRVKVFCFKIICKYRLIFLLRSWLVVVILQLGDTDLRVPMRNLTFPYTFFGMTVSAISMATLNHLETPNRVDEEFRGGLNGLGQ